MESGFEGTIHVTRRTVMSNNVYLKYEIPVKGYNINGIRIGTYATSFSINDNILSLSGYFNDSTNEYRARLDQFVPII